MSSRGGGSRESASSRSRDTSSSASAPERTALVDRLTIAIATLLGAGRAPIGPGTVASAMAALAIWALPVSRGGLVALFAVVTAVGTWAAHRAERLLGDKDASVIVIDEVAGMTLSVLAFPATPAVLASGFVLFRVFDVIKPFPAREAERLAGGAGIMADDLIAGLYALGVLGLCRALVGWP